MITYKGVASDAFDTEGFFDVFGGDINGQAFEAIYTLDTEAAGRIYFESGNVSEYRGGTRFGPGVANPLTAVLKIGGVTLDVGSPGSYFGITSQQNSTIDEISHAVVVERTDSPFSDFSMSHRIRSNVFSFIDTLDQSQPLSYTVTPGHFDFFGQPAAEGYLQNVEYDEFGQEVRFSAVSLIPTSITVAPLAINAVPEPASWALMIGGLGLIGAMARRRPVRVTYA